MELVIEKIQQTGIVPVVVLENAMDAAPLAKALCEGGLPCAEVTFRTGKEYYKRNWVMQLHYGCKRDII